MVIRWIYLGYFHFLPLSNIALNFPCYMYRGIKRKEQTTGRGNRFASALIYLTARAVKDCKHRTGSLSVSLWLLQSHSQLGFVWLCFSAQKSAWQRCYFFEAYYVGMHSLCTPNRLIMFNTDESYPALISAVKKVTSLTKGT